MSDEYDAFHKEHWGVAPASALVEMFQLLSIPPLPGFSPVAITAVGASMSSSGRVAHYPMYAQLMGVNLTEETEVRIAIATLQRGLQLQAEHRRARGDG